MQIRAAEITTTRFATLLLVCFISTSAAAPAQGTTVISDDSESVVLREGLLVDGVGRYGRSPVHQDALEAMLLDGSWTAPNQADQLIAADGTERTWLPISADEKGWFSDRTRRGGYICVRVDSDRDRIMLLHMMGNSMAYINGVPRVGSRYQSRDEVQPWEPNFNFVRLPVHLKNGSNEILLKRAWRAGGRVKAALIQPKAAALLNTDDMTLPDLIVGKEVHTVGSVVVINATERARTDLQLSVVWPDQHQSITKIPIIQPLSVRKIAFPIENGAAAPTSPGATPLQLVVSETTGDTSTVLDRREIALQVKKPSETHKRTFLSHIDRSVQYYALNPAAPSGGHSSPRALVLSLHGASVEAINQANSYAPKRWCHIVSPTNRRPYGFDWEDWGRLDALEVLAHASETLDLDPHRVYLTGHSMGGHGTWILGSTFPDKFAAIGPSAGWLSFWSYRGATKTETPSRVETMLMRAESAGDTLALVDNLAPKGVYILHGGADRNVRADQSHTIVEQLDKFHKDFIFHEEPGQGHWWDLSDAPGADCVDWPPMFDFFARHSLPGDDAVRQVDFTTANPGFSDACHWVAIEDQIQHLQLSSVSIRVEPNVRRFVGTTDNVARLRLELQALSNSDPVSVELDGQAVSDIAYPAGEPRIWMERRGGQWKLAGKPPTTAKGPHRYGPFKAAFRHQMVFVLGTQGTADENAWARNKARFDAEQWWYQGNGSVDIIADVDFDPSHYPDRGIILYGNAKSNGAWNQLLADSPVQVGPGRVTIGDRALEGNDLACLVLRPRSDSQTACVAAISGSGIDGMRLTNRIQHVFAGCNYPDCIVIDPKMLTEGAAGVRVAGLFGSDWSVDLGEFTWAEDEPAEAPSANTETKPKTLPPYIGPDPRPFVMPRSYVCQRAEEPIDVDGRIDESAWKKAAWTEYHVDIEGQMRKVEPKYKTRNKMLWDDQYFYVASQLAEPHVWGTIVQRNAVIFNDNDIEVFIDPDSDNHNYYEFEMNTLNTVWNLFLDKPYKNGGTARIREMPGQKSGVYVKGTLNDPSDTDQYWTVEIAFPWTAMAEFAGTACPPNDGDQWRVGFSRVEWGHKVVSGKYVRVPSEEEKTESRHEDNWVWSPQGRINMHRPETWGYVQFSTKPVGSEVAFEPDPTVRVRHLLHKILYAQEAFVLKHGRYAKTLPELGLESLSDETLTKPIMLRVKPNGWQAVGRVSLGEGKTKEVIIRQDGQISSP